MHLAGDKILDDPSRYDFDKGSGRSWRRVLIRVPGITDFRGIFGIFGIDGGGSNIRYPSGQDDEMIAQYLEGEE